MFCCGLLPSIWDAQISRPQLPGRFECALWRRRRAISPHLLLQETADLCVGPRAS